MLEEEEGAKETEVEGMELTIGGGHQRGTGVGDLCRGCV